MIAGGGFTPESRPVAEFRKLFLDTWKNQEGPELSKGHYFPPLEKVRDDLWSFLRNNKVNAVILGKDFAPQ